MFCCRFVPDSLRREASGDEAYIGQLRDPFDKNDVGRLDILHLAFPGDHPARLIGLNDFLRLNSRQREAKRGDRGDTEPSAVGTTPDRLFCVLWRFFAPIPCLPCHRLHSKSRPL